MQLAVDIKPNRYLRYFLYLLVFAMALPFFTSCESRKTIVNGLDEREANEILVFLSSKNIDAVKVVTPSGGGRRLEIDYIRHFCSFRSVY